MTLSNISLKDSQTVFGGMAIASDPSVIKIGNEYLMFYTDLELTNYNTAISVAKSSDGVTWERVDAPGDAYGSLLSGPNSFETAEAVVIDGKVIVYVAEYREADANGLESVLTAYVVHDDFSVTPLTDAPVLTSTKNGFDSDAIFSPTVIEFGGQYVMYYVGHDYSSPNPTGVNLLSATSTDGVSWTKQDTPVLSPGDGPSWAAEGFGEPSVVVGSDGRVHLFFTGLDGQERVIGYASADHPGAPFEVAETPVITAADVPGGADQVLAPTVMIEKGQITVWYFAYDEDGGYRVARAAGSFGAAEDLEAVDDGVVLHGTPKSDYLLGGTGNDSLYGGRGADSLNGGTGNDSLYGGRGADSLEGGTGNDSLYGGRGADSLEGGTGNDSFYGGRFADWLDGGAGDDDLTGGPGDDTFVFASGFGHDTVKDFEIGLDRVVLDLPYDVIAGLWSQPVAGGAKLWLADDSITFRGLTTEDLGLIDLMVA